MLLIFSAICEALWNICLTKSKGFTDWTPNTLGILLLVGGILSFKKSLDFMPLSIAIVIWSGLSLILTILLDVYFFKTSIDYRVAFFMVLCIVSIIGLNFFAHQ